jgi:hypothetical protein
MPIDGFTEILSGNILFGRDEKGLGGHPEKT